MLMIKTFELFSDFTDVKEGEQSNGHVWDNKAETLQDPFQYVCPQFSITLIQEYSNL